MSDSFNLDFDRTRRLGFPEVIYGASKPVDALAGILDAYRQRQLPALVTKMQPEKAKVLKRHFPDSLYDEASGAFLLDASQAKPSGEPQIGILSAGTSDVPIVNEAYYTLSFLNVASERINDIGIAGIHRLLDRVESLKRFRALIVVAGFEGALPTAVGGLLPQPIIAVPASVGYGVAAGGHVALNTMLASCANGITVVNIDNGYGAAMAAYRILRLVDGAS
ncbi:nickel pincer cofactor biosynthesis protein LarB [Pelagicoccus sp. SDUM812003]|uniref:nickel pincer cofactor biosynthesis protein LarB n=1 Tax=Pelagicoccus sp. SDUM812003 TaxID=3041267 RepID=UPI00281049FC|nr:nickel pincer cofactor biosynthesis protein LarB [Pelagicoccus sp. SDUM812003]MDQ8202685.1 nickel pincer cofactor biosynthesis protein LarB [Pelagicoccus sp. SDUM812003]